MRWREWVAFTAVCAWGASSWLLPVNAEGPSVLVRQGVTWSLVCLAGVCIGFGRRKRARLSVGVLDARLALASVLCFGLPTILLQRAKDYAPETNVTIIFALAPVAVVLAWSAIESGGRGNRLLMPALVGAAGVLFLLPYETPLSVRGWESLVEAFVAMLLVAAAGVWMHKLLADSDLARSLVLSGLVNAVVFLGAAVVRSELALNAWTWEAGLEVAVASAVGALTMWLLRAMDPVRFSSRFLAIPLLTVLLGAVLLRAGLSGRMAVGVVLLLVGTGWLMASRAVEDEVLTLK